MKQQNENTLYLKVGETKTHSLEGNPTTGYTWTCAVGDSSLVEISETIIPKAQNERITGGGSIFTYEIKALRPGETTLNFAYQRPWETGILPVESDTLQIIIAK